MRTYIYQMSGDAADGQTWSVDGTIALEAGDFAAAFQEAMRDGFMQLTGGKAQFGKPGIGCVGPYTVVHFEIALEGRRS